MSEPAFFLPRAGEGAGGEAGGRAGGRVVMVIREF
ncbi:hypothetical protein WCLP8_130006 [uncultured Gammaproteobacteria bacterium]